MVHTHLNADSEREFFNSEEGLGWRKLLYREAKINSTTGSSIILAAFGMVNNPCNIFIYRLVKIIFIALKK